MSQKDLDDAVGAELSGRSAVEAAQAAVEESQLNLGFTSITSPVDGIAGIAKAQLGDLVGPNMQTITSAMSECPAACMACIRFRAASELGRSDERWEPTSTTGTSDAARPLGARM